MSKILFCNLAWMDYYKGIYPGIDVPEGGGDYVKKTHNAHEKYNFEKVLLDFSVGPFEPGEYCLGFVETKTTHVNQNQLHIEKIDGCELAIDEVQVDDVLVVFCAKHPIYGFTTIVGWYKHATIYRYYQTMDFLSNDDNDDVYTQYYNIIAKSEDCVLLPRSERSKKAKWEVPRRNTGASFGFGQSNIWFATNKDENQLLESYLNRIVKQINEYYGENWLDKYPETGC